MQSQTEILENIKLIIAQMMGADAEDIDDDDSLIDDLHMRPHDLSDLIVTLSQKGYETANIDMTGIETIIDLAEFLENEKQ